MSALVQLVDVSKTIRVGFWGRPKTLLSHVAFELTAGTITGFVGHNGAGKSTTIKLMIGAARPSEGTVTVLGGSPRDPAIRRRLGYLPELPRLPPTLTPRELLTSHARLAGVPPAHTRPRVEALLERVRLSAEADQLVGSFSKGMQQRVGIGLALVGEPELLIFDEPMSGLDPTGRRLVREILLEQRAAGRTVFFSSHVLPDVEALCDSLVLLHRGRVVAQGKMADVLQGRPRGAEITFSGTESVGDWARDLGRLSRQGDLFVLSLGPDRDVVDAAVRLREAGCHLVGVQTLRAHLEDELMNLTDESGGAAT